MVERMKIVCKARRGRWLGGLVLSYQSWNVQCTDSKEQDHAESGYNWPPPTPRSGVSSAEEVFKGDCWSDGIV